MRKEGDKRVVGRKGVHLSELLLLDLAAFLDKP
jgi:hypothetical protein